MLAINHPNKNIFVMHYNWLHEFNRLNSSMRQFSVFITCIHSKSQVLIDSFCHKSIYMVYADK